MKPLENCHSKLKETPLFDYLRILVEQLSYEQVNEVLGHMSHWMKPTYLLRSFVTFFSDFNFGFGVSAQWPANMPKKRLYSLFIYCVSNIVCYINCVLILDNDSMNKILHLNLGKLSAKLPSCKLCDRSYSHLVNNTLNDPVCGFYT